MGEEADRIIEGILLGEFDDHDEEVKAEEKEKKKKKRKKKKA